MRTLSTLTGSNDSAELERETIINTADRVLLRDEWAIGYEEPVGAIYEENTPDRRGYITVWWRNADGSYVRKQMLSGDDRWIRQRFGELAEKDTDAIERFVGFESAPQP